MACHRALKELEAMNVLQCVAKGKSHTPARWNWTGVGVDELVLPSPSSVAARAKTAVFRRKSLFANARFPKTLVV
jgi:hypothetical protein